MAPRASPHVAVGDESSTANKAEESSDICADILAEFAQEDIGSSDVASNIAAARGPRTANRRGRRRNFFPDPTTATVSADAGVADPVAPPTTAMIVSAAASVADSDPVAPPTTSIVSADAINVADDQVAPTAIVSADAGVGVADAPGPTQAAATDRRRITGKTFETSVPDVAARFEASKCPLVFGVASQFPTSDAGLDKATLKDVKCLIEEFLLFDVQHGGQASEVCCLVVCFSISSPGLISTLLVLFLFSTPVQACLVVCFHPVQRVFILFSSRGLL